MLAACGGAPAPAIAPATTPPPSPRARTIEDRAPIDPIAVLGPAESVSWLVPGRVQLELGGITTEGPGGSRAIEVSLIDRQGNLVRAAVRLEHARFSLWTDRSRLLAVLRRDHELAAIHRPNDDTHVILRAGAVVRRLGHKNKQTQIRYTGAVEVEGWVPDEILGESGEQRRRVGRIPRFTRLGPQHVFPGVVIRSEPRWAGAQLAVAVTAYMLDTVREIDQAWAEIGYADGDVSVQGYVSRRDPPGRVHRPKDPDIAPQQITANAKVASGTCLYTHVKGEAIGYVVGDQDVMLDDAGRGWWALTIDSPWGPLPFAAQGPGRADLVACAPVDSVPPPALTAPTPTP